MDLSIIIVSWNSEERLRRCLASVFAETSDISFEVIVVDNASADRTIQVAMNEFGPIRIIQNESNRGFAAAVNQGIEVSTGRYVCLLNPDTVLTDRALEHMVAALDRDNSIGLMGPHLLNEDRTTQASVRRFPGFADQAMILMKLHTIFPDAKSLYRYFYRNFDYSRTQDVEQLMGACLLIRREVIEEVGILDETFFIWFEEVDYCRRVAQRSHYRITYYAQAHVVHVGGDSFQKVALGKKQRWYKKSVRYYFRKHKQWGAYLGLLVLAPFSLAIGLLARVVARSKQGRKAIEKNRENIKHVP